MHDTSTYYFRNYIITVLLLACFSTMSLAQQAERNFYSLYTPDELPNNSVLDIMQDQKGFMWFGTPNGLCRYDANRLKLFQHDVNNAASISNNNISKLLTDKKGNLWIGTGNGINLFNAKESNFKRYLDADTKKRGVFIKSIFEDVDSILWVGTSKGLFKMKGRNNFTFQKVQDQPFPSEQYSERYFSSICQDLAGNIWTSGNKVIYKFSKNGKILAQFDCSAYFKNTASSEMISALAIDKEQRLWIGGSDGSLLFINCTQGIFEKYAPLSIHQDKYQNRIFQIYKDVQNGMWIVGFHGIIHHDSQTLETKHYLNDPDKPNNLIDNGLLSVHQSKDGIMWFGTYNSGVTYILPNSERFHNISAGKASGLSYNIVTAISAKDKDHLFIGTASGGLNILDLKSKKASPIAMFDQQQVPAVLTDRDGNIWVGTSGIKHYNAQKKTWQHFLNSDSDTNTLSSNTIHKIMQDHQGKIWVATRSGLDYFNPQTGKFARTNFWGNPKPVQTIFEDSKRNIWMSANSLDGNSRNSTLILENGSDKPRPIPIDETNNTPARYITHFHEDIHGNIWAAGGRLLKYNPKRKVMELYESDALYNRSAEVISIQSDKQGRLWISMSNHLAMLDTKTKKVIHFSKTDGVLGNEFNLNSSYQDSNGNFYHGTNQGILYFNPESIKLNTVPPKVAFSELKVNGKTILANDSSKILDQDILYAKKIELPYNHNYFELHFSVLNYFLPNKNAFEYKLDGVDQVWHRIHTPSVTFNNLAQGHYKLLIRGYNNDTFVSDTAAELEIVILPPWWKTWWAYLIYAFILLSIICIIFRLWLLKARYGQTVQLNAYKMDFFTNISHEIRTHLTLILSPLEKAAQNTQVHDNVKVAQNSAHKLLALVTELMDFQRLESNQVQLHVKEHNLTAIIETLVPIFDHIVQQKEITVSVNAAPSKITAYFDLFQMEKAIFNLLSNAFKFVEQAGHIDVSVQENEKDISIKISDDGKGIDKEHLGNLFQNYFQVYEYGDKNTGYGVGLSLSKGIVELHQGSLTVTSIINQPDQKNCTCFEIKLLKGSDHFTAQQRIPSPLPISAINEIGEPVLSAEREMNADTELETILIAEDHEELRQFIASCFPQYTIIQCADGQDAWEKAREILPDLIITDIMMPGMTGTELCKKIKQDELTCHIPVIMLTAKASEIQIIEGLQSRADHYITKPFHVNELELKVINLLTLRNTIRNRAKGASNLKDFENTLSNKIDKEFIAKVNAIIEENISDDQFGVDQLAKAIGIGRAVLYKKIKAITGMSVNDFVKILRINHAAMLLRANVYHVNEVTEMVGFNDRRYFSKEFAKIMGKIPSQYAKDFKKEII